ncbi:hypothetical protein [Allomuricauda sp. SCSIO 65647]|uniref:hypothetical protein n=1 Tax=Allomuricauda sp. SCSIO 65647 TaxID=2908843 RepID=UPI001F2CC38A|nr:hypothetical protein [Muricauda sp. SCSIO 65647]UJH67770.1 hypothetical protein L0P89_00790 [Muricauda sp. SCSIO 65647]
MKSIKIIGLGICLLFGVQDLLSQEMASKKYDNPQWYNIVYVDYKPGTYDKAQSIIQDYFIKASEKAGTPQPVMALELNSGSYDSMLLWHMKEGVEGMNWDISPDDVKWRTALNEIAGSAEKASEILKDYQSCIASSSNTIARLR